MQPHQERLGLRGLDICTGCGPGAMKGPMKGATIGHSKQRIRDGRSSVTRRVSARQHGRPIYYLTANFQVPETGLEHQDGMPDDWERTHKLDPNDASDGPADADKDGYTNVEEYLYRTDPHTFVDYTKPENNRDQVFTAPSVSATNTAAPPADAQP